MDAYVCAIHAGCKEVFLPCVLLCMGVYVFAIHAGCKQVIRPYVSYIDVPEI